MEIVTEEAEAEQEVVTSQDAPITSRANKLLPNKPQQLQQQSDVTHLYMGEDVEERYSGVDALFMTTDESDHQPLKYGPRVEIPKEKYISMFKQWRDALILKLLGKTVNYRVLEQRVCELWQLELGFELIDLAEGYYVVQVET